MTAPRLRLDRIGTEVGGLCSPSAKFLIVRPGGEQAVQIPLCGAPLPSGLTRPRPMEIPVVYGLRRGVFQRASIVGGSVLPAPFLGPCAGAAQVQPRVVRSRRDEA